MDQETKRTKISFVMKSTTATNSYYVYSMFNSIKWLKRTSDDCQEGYRKKNQQQQSLTTNKYKTTRTHTHIHTANISSLSRKKMGKMKKIIIKRSEKERTYTQWWLYTAIGNENKTIITNEWMNEKQLEWANDKRDFSIQQVNMYTETHKVRKKMCCECFVKIFFLLMHRAMCVVVWPEVRNRWFLCWFWHDFCKSICTTTQYPLPVGPVGLLGFLSTHRASYIIIIISFAFFFIVFCFYHFHLHDVNIEILNVCVSYLVQVRRRIHYQFNWNVQ